MEYNYVSIMDERMALKVCQVCAVDFTVEKFLTPLIDGMLNEGWDVTTVCSDGPSISNLRNKGYNIYTIPIARSMNPFKALRGVYFLYRYFNKANFDIIHVHTPVASLLARIAAYFSKTNAYIIYTAHGFYFHDEMPIVTKKIFIYLEKITGKFTDLLFCQSSEDALDAEKEGIMPGKDIITIGNGVDIEKYNISRYEILYHDIRSELNIPLNAKVVGIVARMVREKGYIELLQAAINLKKTHDNLYFLLIGGRLKSDHDIGIEEALKEAKYKLNECIIDLGMRQDVPRLISVMDIFCLPSHREGLPRTIIEAMFLKKPVVATNIRGCREEVVNNETGLLVPVKNVEELTKALDYLLKNQKIAKKMGERGYQIAKKCFNENDVVKVQIDCIKQRIGI